MLEPDWRTLRPYPGSPDTLVCLCDVYDAGASRLRVDPRGVLTGSVEKAEKAGWVLKAATELEFYLFEASVRDLRQRRFLDMVPTTLVRSDYNIVRQAVQEPFIGAVRREMERCGIPIYACQAEHGLGQWEVNFCHTDPLVMADQHVIYKAGIKEMAAEAGLGITFMARPIGNDTGSSCHVHFSVYRDEVPVLADAESPGELSDDGLAFVGGVLAHLDELAVLYAPAVNSYKRHLTQDFGGGIKAWGYDNRTVALRIVGVGAGLNVEVRYPGADVNPHLALTAILESGLDGIARHLDPGPPMVGTAYRRPDLPQTLPSLDTAISRFEESEFAARVLGPAAVTYYADLAKAEWAAYMRSVTDWEVSRGFESS
ncbi:MAG TPA: glutamine synthetase family protein [Candidatus Acidoferrales bacterium]|nr:glutamine synthetase family protein [Candidatus Acidoferrales bacterium]